MRWGWGWAGVTVGAVNTNTAVAATRMTFEQLKIVIVQSD